MRVSARKLSEWLGVNHVTTKEPPVNTGEIILCKMKGIGRKGNYLTEYEGYVIFINELTGYNLEHPKMCRVEIQRVCPKFGFGLFLGYHED